MAKDRRLYARFDINMDEHPKIAGLSDAAFRALFESIFYARRQLTDGFIDDRVMQRRWGHDVANEIASNDIDKPSLVKVDGGYQIHDFAEHQVTTADIQAKRDAGRKGGIAKASNLLAGATEKPLHIASTTLAKTETETETVKRPSSNAAHSKEFDSFWEHYPRKVGKLVAKKAFLKALTLTDVGNIQEALRRLHQEVRGKDAQFIPHPATWLNQGRWDDEPTQQPKSAWTKEFHNG